MKTGRNNSCLKNFQKEEEKSEKYVNVMCVKKKNKQKALESRNIVKVELNKNHLQLFVGGAM